MPDNVAYPDTVEQVADLMREATAAGRPVCPAGAATRSRPDPAALTIGTINLNRVLTYEPADLTLSAQAGATMHSIRLQAARQQQQVALDAAAHVRATLGGTVALNAAGPLRLRYGTPRDQVLGIQLVTGDGRIVNLGGKVVKNVAGYDLTRLVVGSRGALGIVTAVHLRLFPLPANDVTFVVTGETDQLLPCVQRVQQAHFEPAALELHVDDYRSQLLVRVQGNDDVIQAARHLTGELGLERDELVRERAQNVWTGIAERELSAPILIRLAALPAALEQTIRLARRIADTLEVSKFAAHAASGIVRLGGVAYDQGATSNATAQVCAEIERMSGTLQVTRAPFALPQSQLQPALLSLLDGLKRTFDPAGILPQHWRDPAYV